MSISPSSGTQGFAAAAMASMPDHIEMHDTDEVSIDEVLIRDRLYRNPDITSIDISGCKKLGGRTIEMLSHFKKLEILNISFCDLEDHDLYPMDSVRTLIISHNPKLTNAGLKNLVPSNQLTEIHLYGCPQINDFTSLQQHPEFKKKFHESNSLMSVQEHKALQQL